MAVFILSFFNVYYLGYYAKWSRLVWSLPVHNFQAYLIMCRVTWLCLVELLGVSLLCRKCTKNHEEASKFICPYLRSLNSFFPRMEDFSNDHSKPMQEQARLDRLVVRMEVSAPCSGKEIGMHASAAMSCCHSSAQVAVNLGQRSCTNV